VRRPHPPVGEVAGLLGGLLRRRRNLLYAVPAATIGLDSCRGLHGTEDDAGPSSPAVDVLPVLKDGDSCRAALRGTSVGSCFTASSQGKPWSYTGSTGV
jgi:hypothetical protein